MNYPHTFPHWSPPALLTLREHAYGEGVVAHRGDHLARCARRDQNDYLRRWSMATS